MSEPARTDSIVTCVSDDISRKLNQRTLAFLLVAVALAIGLGVAFVRQRSIRIQSVHALMSGGAGGALEAIEIDSSSMHFEVHHLEINDSSSLRDFESACARSASDRDLDSGDISVGVTLRFTNGARCSIPNAMLHCAENRLILWLDILQPNADAFTHEIVFDPDSTLWSKVATVFCASTDRN